MIILQELHFPQQTTEVEPGVDLELKVDDRLPQPEPPPDQTTENPLPEAATGPNQEATSLDSSAEPEPAAETKDGSGAVHLQDDPLHR